MIATLFGKLKSVGKDHAIVETGGIGFAVSMAASALAALPVPGHEVQVYTSLIIRETGWTLFGFLTEEEKSCFELLLNVNGVGPKSGLSLVGALGPRGISEALDRGDHVALSRVPGIGKKTAERLCLDLRGKVDFKAGPGAEQGNFWNSKAKDALQALLHLGYTNSIAEKAVKTTMEDLGGDPDLGTLIKTALSRAGR